MQFPGARCACRRRRFLQVFREVCDSLVHHGLGTLVAVNGHGGNVAALTVAINHYFETTGRRSSSRSGGTSPRTCSRRSRGR
jgi:creatinine amidohydrolase/Fe(II)-dependent formamide hydrolase-like protein